MLKGNKNKRGTFVHDRLSSNFEMMGLFVQTSR